MGENADAPLGTGGSVLREIATRFASGRLLDTHLRFPGLATVAMATVATFFSIFFPFVFLMTGTFPLYLCNTSCTAGVANALLSFNCGIRQKFKLRASDVANEPRRKYPYSTNLTALSLSLAPVSITHVEMNPILHSLSTPWATDS